MTKLEEAGYVEIEKRFVGRKPRRLTWITDRRRREVEDYRRTMQQALENLK